MRSPICILLFIILVSVAKAQYSYNISYHGHDTSLTIVTPSGLPQNSSGRYRAYDAMKYGRNGFEQNKLLSIKNIGHKSIENLQLAINKDEFVYTYKELLDKADLSNLSSIDDTLKALYKFISDWHIAGTVSTNGENGGSNWIRKIQSYNTFGAGDCSNNAQILRGMLTALGYSAKVIMLQNYHAVVFVFLNNGRTVFLDGEYRGLYTSRYSDSLADVTEMLDDADIIRRQRHLGIEMATTFPYDYMTRAFTGNCWRVPLYLTDEIDSLNLAIFPNEEYRFWYDVQIPEGKHSYYNHSLRYPILPPPPTAAKGEQITSVLPDTIARFVFFNSNGIRFVSSDSGIKAILDTDKVTGSLLLRVQNPFVITDADILYTTRISGKGGISFDYGRDTTNFQTVESYASPYDVQDSINLFRYIRPQDLPMLNEYYIRIKFTRDSANMVSPELLLLKLKTTFQFNPNAIPKLDAGNNLIKLQGYHGNNIDVKIGMEFTPLENASLPAEVQFPLFPQNGQSVSGSKFKFQWRFPSLINIATVTDYRVQVSERTDFKTVVSSTFDHFDETIEQSQLGIFQIPQRGLLQSNKTYYWRVAYRRNDGVWSNWSSSWSFTITAPKPPRLVIDNSLADKIIIKALSQSSNNRISEKFILKGNNKLGFKWEDGITVDTLTSDSILISGRDANKIFSFYRAVAIDDNGVESGPSEPLSFGYGNFVISKEPVIQDGIKAQLNIVSPDVYLEWLTFEGEVKIDTFRTNITAVKLPEGFVHDTAKVFIGKANIGDSICIFESSVTAPVSPQNIFYNTPYEPQFENKECVLKIRHNNSPLFITEPDEKAFEDSLYSYQAFAQDEDSVKDGDWVKYRLLSSSWLSIDSISGLVTGIPRIKDLYDTKVHIEAYDLWGGVATQSFAVAIEHVNHAPIIVSNAETVAREDVQYSYQVLANDIDTVMGDSLRFKLLVHPSWLSIDSITGHIQGKPDRFNIGDTLVEVVVEDRNGLWALQRFNLQVLQSYFPPSPVITENPRKDDALSLPASTLTFTWSRPEAYYDTLWYSFHLVGEGIDTIIRRIYDTAITISISNRLYENKSYLWWVVVRDGRTRVTPKDTSRFFVKPIMSVTDNYVIPEKFILWQNFPNPFNETTSIRFGIPELSQVRMNIIDISGKTVARLLNGKQRQGTYTIEWSPPQILTGMYLVQMKATGINSGKTYQATIKMLRVIR